ncbi:hypothetical protein [Desulforamulus ruminis]|uniref:Uncharacterized protein n=1 Tax=Desulforamulus ruminis (strain ATCC 23193 / DSM 2154 / NCIMB 8452 / DL) TaxID=696281 RepID=F6DLP8_DESRL|nr:hypothetical protein [Desulforamulus ruminis]AEG61690.1 hypothetical protein Desru_3487 [Desulforamulus ruminis DSM 2154]
MTWKGIGTEENQETIKTRIGQNTDPAGITTLFARLKQIYDYLTTNLSSSRASKIDNMDTTVSSRQANWGATTTHKDRIDANISSRAAQTTADTINTNVGSNADVSSATGSIHGKLKDIKANISSLASTKGPIGASGSSAVTSDSYITVLDISGPGLLHSIRVSSSISNSVDGAGIRITVDGYVLAQGSCGPTACAANAYCYPIAGFYLANNGSMLFNLISNDGTVSGRNAEIQFKNSLKIEAYRETGILNVEWLCLK